MKAVSEHITNPKDVLNRAAKTAVQTFLGAFGVSQLMDLDVTALEHAIMAGSGSGTCHRAQRSAAMVVVIA